MKKNKKPLKKAKAKGNSENSKPANKTANNDTLLGKNTVSRQKATAKKHKDPETESWHKESFQHRSWLSASNPFLKYYKALPEADLAFLQLKGNLGKVLK